jgi:hypothetical protein
MNRPKKKSVPGKWIKWTGLPVGGVFVALNGMAFMQAWSMMHYEPAAARTTWIRELSVWDKTRLLFQGPTVRRQSNTKTPGDHGMEFWIERFPGAHGISLEAWRVDGRDDLPVVLMFPGYGASKDTLLAAAREFHALGYPLCLVDFHGVGGSGGTSTTIGYDEAEDVAAAATALKTPRYILFGTSMGAAAVLRAVHLGKVQPERLILEAPFDRLLTTVANRFELMKLPPAPLAHLLVFWGGVQQGFNGFAHNPIDYARSVRCPTLVMQGKNDRYVGEKVPSRFARALGEWGTIRVIPDAEHAFLVRAAPAVWKKTVADFLLPSARSEIEPR